jgi:predicted HD superfamily hydrolase involved in NAD metabolism
VRAEDLRVRMEGLPKGLLAHIDRVIVEAKHLAYLWGLDEEQVALAAQGHDLARAVKPELLLERARAFSLTIDPVDEAVPIMLHGPLGALLLQVEHGIDDPEVLDSARYHTTGNIGMSLVQKAIFLADKFEPHKLERRPELQGIKDLAAHDPDAACLAFHDLMLIDATRHRWPLHPLAVAARNRLIMQSDGPTIGQE